MTVFLDIIFIENLIMDLTIIFTTGLILKSVRSIKMVILAGCISSLLYIITLIFPFLFYIQTILPVIIVVVAFKFNGIKGLLKHIFLFYFISFLYGGISFALMNLLNNGKLNMLNGVIIGNYSISIVFVSGILGFILIWFVIKRKNKPIIKKILIRKNSIDVRINVLLDTGNLLKDPYMNKPVIIVEKNALEGIIEKEIINNFELIIAGKVELPEGVFLIPYMSIGNKRNFLLGIKPDNLFFEENMFECDSIVGICGEKLSEKGAYSGIFGIDTLDGGICLV